MKATDKRMTAKSVRHIWADLCSLRAGLGRVRLLEPADTPALLELLAHSRPLLLLGRGTNVIGSDNHDLAVLRLPAQGRLAQIKPLGDGCFAVGCGIRLSKMLFLLARAGFGGHAGLSGIPGSLGGALAMNAGARGQEIGAAALEMHGYHLTTGRQWHWTADTGGWSYRTSPVPSKVILTSAIMRLQKTDAKLETESIKSELRRRQATNPPGASAGSVFRNPTPELPAGKLLEEAGCKNMRQGAFMVSQQHANWIINQSGTPGAAKDCRQLVQQMAAAVAQTHGVKLQCEWKLID